MPALWSPSPTGEVVGVANLGRLDDRPVMWKLYVHPDQQGRRPRHRACSAAIVEAWSTATPLWLEYLDGNDAGGRLLPVARSSWRSSRCRQPPYPGPTVWMRRDL